MLMYIVYIFFTYQYERSKKYIHPGEIIIFTSWLNLNLLHLWVKKLTLIFSCTEQANITLRYDSTHRIFSHYTRLFDASRYDFLHITHKTLALRAKNLYTLHNDFGRFAPVYIHVTQRFESHPGGGKI